MSYIQNNLVTNFGLPDVGVGYQKCQAGSPNGYLDFGVISTPVRWEDCMENNETIMGGHANERGDNRQKIVWNEWTNRMIQQYYLDSPSVYNRHQGLTRCRYERDEIIHHI